MTALSHRQATLELLLNHYGPALGLWILHNLTVYPANPEREWEQAKELVRDGLPDDPEVRRSVDDLCVGSRWAPDPACVTFLPAGAVL